MSILTLDYRTRRAFEKDKLWSAREFFEKPGVIKASQHVFRTGSKDDYYFDFDYFISEPDKSAMVLDIFANLVDEIKQEATIDILAFIEKSSGGTVGAIRLSVALSIRTNLPHVIVRPAKGIIWERVKGLTANNRDKNFRTIIVSDHCTSGNEVMEAASELRANGFIVNDAVVYTIRPDKIEAQKLKDDNIDLRYAFALPAKFTGVDSIAINY